jgi:hypothetical protein
MNPTRLRTWNGSAELQRRTDAPAIVDADANRTPDRHRGEVTQVNLKSMTNELITDVIAPAWQ